MKLEQREILALSFLNNKTIYLLTKLLPIFIKKNSKVTQTTDKNIKYYSKIIKQIKKWTRNLNRDFSKHQCPTGR